MSDELDDLPIPPPNPPPHIAAAPANPPSSSAPVETTASSGGASAAPPGAGDLRTPINQVVDDGKRVNPGDVKVQGKLDGNCIHCGVPMGSFLGSMTPEGPLHNECVPAYRRGRVERCAHCDCVLRQGRSLLNGKKLHPECVADFKAKKTYVPPTRKGLLMKFSVGRSFFCGKNWKSRYFVLSKGVGFAYFESQQEFDGGKPPKGAITFTPQTRLVTHPNKRIHREAENPSLDFMILFHEGAEERRLLCAAKTWQEHDEWVKDLECYIKIVDDPKDLKDD